LPSSVETIPPAGPIVCEVAAPVGVPLGVGCGVGGGVVSPGLQLLKDSRHAARDRNTLRVLGEEYFIIIAS